MKLGDRVIHEHVLDLAGVHVLGHQLRHRLQGLPPAERAVIVGYFDQRDLRGGVALRWARPSMRDRLVDERVRRRALCAAAGEALQQRLDRLEVALHRLLLRLERLRPRGVSAAISSLWLCGGESDSSASTVTLVSLSSIGDQILSDRSRAPGASE